MVDLDEKKTYTKGRTVMAKDLDDSAEIAPRKSAELAIAVASHKEQLKSLFQRLEKVESILDGMRDDDKLSDKMINQAVNDLDKVRADIEHIFPMIGKKLDIKDLENCEQKVDLKLEARDTKIENVKSDLKRSMKVTVTIAVICSGLISSIITAIVVKLF